MKEVKKRETMKSFGLFGVILKLVLVLSLFLAAEIGFSRMVSEVLRPELTPDTVRKVGERSWVVNDMNERLRFLQNELKFIVHGKISNCSCSDSKWEVSKVLLDSLFSQIFLA